MLKNRLSLEARQSRDQRYPTAVLGPLKGRETLNLVSTNCPHLITQISYMKSSNQIWDIFARRRKKLKASIIRVKSKPSHKSEELPDGNNFSKDPLVLTLRKEEKLFDRRKRHFRCSSKIFLFLRGKVDGMCRNSD